MRRTVMTDTCIYDMFCDCSHDCPNCPQCDRDEPDPDDIRDMEREW